MPLLSILEEIASDLGNKLSVPSEKAKLITRVNTAARSLYDGNELEGSLREEIFDINQESHQIVFPPRVGQARGFRYVDSGVRGDIVTVQARYHHGDFSREVWLLTFRELEPKSPLYHDIVNETRITLTLKEPALEAFKVIINGSNTNSDSVQDVVEFAVDDIEKETTHSYTGVRAISKNITTSQNIAFYDADETLLAVMPNYEDTLEHVIIQISDDSTTVSDLQSIEWLYKIRYIPMIKDYDEFICGSKYDQAIIYKYLELYNLKRAKDFQQAAAMKGLVQEELQDIGQDQKRGKKMKLNVTPNSTFRIFSGMRHNGVYYK